MMSSNSIAEALWFAWDGAEHAVLGRSDGRVVEVTSRKPECEIFLVRTLDASGEPADLLDFFWVRRNRAFLRPLILPRAVTAIEVAALTGRGAIPLARYHLDAAGSRAGMQCDLVFAQPRRGEEGSNQLPLVGRQGASFAEAEDWLTRLQGNPGRSLIWALAAPFETIGESDLLERRAAPVSILFPRTADLIKANPVPYRNEKEEIDPAQRLEREPAIKSVARESRHVISLEVEAPLSEVSQANSVPGVVIFHYMKQRELIALWDKTTPLLRFTVADLEGLDKCDYPFARPDQVFVARPLSAHAGLIDGLRIHASDHRSGNGLVCRFTIDFAFASLGDLLVVYDMVGKRLVGDDSAARRCLTFRVGPTALEYQDIDSEIDKQMIEAAHKVVDSDYDTLRQPAGDGPSHNLIVFLQALVRATAFDGGDLIRRPLLPLFAIAYAAHAKQAAEAGSPTDYPTFERDPGVRSIAVLTPLLLHVKAVPPRPRYSGMPKVFSSRLAAELGVSGLLMPVAGSDADVRATDLLTDPRSRPLWEDAGAVGVSIDITNPDIDGFIQRLKEFRGWCENPDTVDELANANDGTVGEQFRAFLDEQQPYRRPVAALDLDHLYALVQPLALEVSRSTTVVGGGWTNLTASSARDPRSNEQLKADYTKVLNEALAHPDPKVRSIAKSHADADYPRRKQMLDAEKELKDLIGSPPIGADILALIDKLEGWAGIDSVAGVRGSDDRRERILNLTRASRLSQKRFELSPVGRLGLYIRPKVEYVEKECGRLRASAAGEDGEILSALPHYARLLCFHAAYRSLCAARAKADGLPESAIRLLSLWPERADDCWDRYDIWAKTQGGPEAAAEMAKSWSLSFGLPQDGVH
jgi:hypothetical protein